MVTGKKFMLLGGLSGGGLAAVFALTAATRVEAAPAHSRPSATPPTIVALTGGDGEPVQIHTFKTHSRLIFRVSEWVETEWRDVDRGFELFFRNIRLTDLGAPMRGAGSLEAEWVRHFEAKIRDARMESVSIRETPEGVRVKGAWNFPKGPLPDDAPATLAMDRFEYRERNPGRLVVDFWQRKGPTVAEVRLAKARKDREEAQKKSEENARIKGKERKARERARQEADDVQKFCERPLADINDIFTPFAPVHEKLDFSRWVSIQNVDSSFTYFRPKIDARDAQYVRTAIDLYDRGKLGLALRAVEFLDSEFPKSPLRAEMTLLKAAALVKLGMEEQALGTLGNVLVEFKESPVAIHVALYTAIRSFENGNYLKALEMFGWLTTNYPEDRMAWLFHMGAAETLVKLKETDRAAREYQWVVENAADPAIQADAVYRFGNLFLERRQYDRALAAYRRIYTHFIEQSKTMGAARVNLAEALYWLRHYDEAEAEFQRFLKDSFSNPAGWRAYFRLGEILARREGEEARASAREHFLKTINRFPFSPGATLSRIRMLPCGDHAGMDGAAAERFFTTEAESFDGGGEVLMANYRDFMTVSRVRSLITLGDYERAVNVAVEELKKDLPVETRFILSGNLGSFFRKTVLELVSRGNPYDALEFYYRQVAAIPDIVMTATKFGLTEFDFLLSLSRIAADYGLGEKAMDLARDYFEVQKAVERNRQAKGVKQVDAGEIDMKLKIAEESFTAAKALWVAEGRSAAVGSSQGAAATSSRSEAVASSRSEAVAKIREHLAKIPDESLFAFEREILLGVLDSREGQAGEALKHASKAGLLATEARLTEDDRDRHLAWLASLQAATGDPRAAIASYALLELRYKDRHGERERNEAAHREVARDAKQVPPGGKGGLAILGVPPAPQHAELLLLEGDILGSNGYWGEAAEAYSRAVAGGHGGNQALFELARATERSGNAERAVEIFRRLASSKQDDFWKELADEALANRGKSDGKPKKKKRSQGGP